MGTDKSITTLINQWIKDYYEPLKERKCVTDYGGEILGTPIPIENLGDKILFIGLNPGKTHGYTIEKNLSELFSEEGLPLDRCWYGWGSHNIVGGIKKILKSLFPALTEEDIIKRVLYTNTSFFRTRHQDTIEQWQFDISYPLVKSFIDTNGKPIFVFGTKAYEYLKRRMNMNLISSHNVGWAKWKVKLFINESNQKMIGLPHLSYDWTTRKEVPEELWTAISAFINT
tara:strand:- start:288 stop:971 length:684 start_codon:yes stop_codon:yes gene_type:complete